MVLAPEHSLVAQITTPDQKAAVEAYVAACASKSDMDRGDLNKDKSGVFTGAYAINPVNQEKIPVWIADYVMMGYGTGAIMAVPAHDERDFEFAKKFDLAVRQVVQEPRSKAVPALSPDAITRHQGENRLPHWEKENAIYAITLRLDDSVPAEVRLQWAAEREDLKLKEESGTISKAEAERLELSALRKSRTWLDAGHGSCVSERSCCGGDHGRCAAPFRWETLSPGCWCVMPNHVHVVLKPMPGHELSDILHSWKSFTAHEINKKFETEGALWQADFYNRIIRDAAEYRCAAALYRRESAAAGLKDWEWVGLRSADGGGSTRPGRPVLRHYCDHGFAVNSGFLDGLPTAEAKAKMIDWLESKGLGKRRIQFKLRDWLFSRQRYWGEPFPIIWENGNHAAHS